jgi:DHA1 family bicyclomycin/chloramphenicol resistance-like MFS transporter
MLVRPMIKPRQLILLTTLNLAILPIGMDVYSAVLSDLAIAFDRDMAWAQYTLSTYLLGFAAAHLLIGPLADHYGRRPVLLGGLLTFTLAAAAAASAQNLETIVLARLVQGFGGAAGPILARAVVRDVSNPLHLGRTLAWSIGWMGMVPLLGPWIAGVSSAAWGWRAPLWIIAAHGLLTMVAMIILLPETLRPATGERRSGAWVEALRILAPDRAFRAWAVCAALGYSGIALWVANASAMVLGRYGKPTSD